MRTPLIVVGPLPPPYHGVTISTQLVLSNPRLANDFDVRHLDTSDSRAGRVNVGRWDLVNARLAARAVMMLVRQLGSRRGIVYLPISQGAPGVFRDSLFIRSASARGWRVAIHLRGSEFSIFYEASNRLFRRWVRSTLSRVDSAAVMGESLTWVFNGLIGSERIAVVPNGTPEPGVTTAARCPDRVLFLSNLRRRKGIVEAVEAALLVIENHSSAHFVFAGEWEDDQLERDLRARASHAKDRLRFLEPQIGSAKDELLASSSVLLFPPREPEGHPRVVLEALAAGVPVVATNFGAIAETVVNGESGFILDEPNPELLAARILTLLEDRELLKSMSAAARRRYLDRYTQEDADRRVAEWLMSVAQLPASPPAL